jgi:beta-lactamase regulating signal transducer with metallopeptidase domain
MIENFDSLARILLEALLNTLWQGMLIAVLVWLLLRLTKQASATTRHAVWLVTLLTIGALPFVALMANQSVPAPNSRAPVKQELAKPAAPPVAAPGANLERRLDGEKQLDGGKRVNAPANPFSLGSGIARLNIPVIQDPSQSKYDFRQGPPLPERIENGARATTLEESVSNVSTMAAVVPRAAVSAAPAATAFSADSVGMKGKSLLRDARTWIETAFSGAAPLLLVGLWLAVCGLMFWRIARSYRAVFRLREQLELMPAEQRMRVRRLAALFGIKRRVHAFTSPRIAMPMTVGSIKPLILLPPDLAAGLSQSEFESVIAHELAHIKRWDYLTNMAQRLVQAFLFFHPAVWFISKQLMIERELACDDWAVKTCEPRRYASCLTKLVEALNDSKPHMAVRAAATGIGGLIFGKHVISRRVEMILNRDRNATTAVSKPALLYVTGLVVMFVAVCSLISPVIAVPLGQKQAKQKRKDGKAEASTGKSYEFPPLSPLTPLPPGGVEAAEPLDIPEIPEPPDAALPAIAAALAPEAELAPLPPPAAIGGIQDELIAPAAPAAPIALAVQTPSPAPGPRVVEVSPLAPNAPLAAIAWGQDDKKREPAIPETELLNLLVDIVKRDADPNVRNEALQGIYRLRSDAAVTALIQLYDGATDPKVKGEIVGYLLRREGDNSKGVAKLTAIAKSETNEELRNRAIRYLGNVKGDEGANNLIQIYDSLQDQKMKQYVIRSLAYNKSRKALDKLILIAKNDSDPVVRQYAVRSLYGVDNRVYLDLIDKDRTRIGPGRVEKEFFAPEPRVFEFNGKAFELDSKRWEEWQQDWQKNWEEQSGKMREMIEKMRIDGLEKMNLDELRNKLRIEMPKIELQLKDLEDKVRIGRGVERIAPVENQLRAQLAVVEAQLNSMRAQYADSDPKAAEIRNLRNALERQLNSLRSMRATTTRPAQNRGGVATPKARVASTAGATSL